MPPRRDLLFVGMQFALLLALAVDPVGVEVAPPALVRYLGQTLCALAVVLGVVAVLQLGTNLTPWPSPKAGSRLVTTGLYAWARHPIYACLAGFAFALVLATGSVWRLGLAMALLWLFWRKATFEEAMLRERYPEYAAYANRVERFALF